MTLAPPSSRKPCSRAVTAASYGVATASRVMPRYESASTRPPLVVTADEAPDSSMLAWVVYLTAYGLIAVNLAVLFSISGEFAPVAVAFVLAYGALMFFSSRRLRAADNAVFEVDRNRSGIDHAPHRAALQDEDG